MTRGHQCIKKAETQAETGRGVVAMTALTQPEGKRLGTGDDRVTAAQ